MGTGKTRVGKTLAQILSWQFIDTDKLIEKELGRPISQIFSFYGEEFFRNKEAHVIKKLKNEVDHMVIAVGGGAILREDNRVNLKKLGILITLSASPDEIARRLSGDTTRPLLQQQDLHRHIEKMLEERKPYYQISDIQIDTTGCSVEDVVKQIIYFSGIK